MTMGTATANSVLDGFNGTLTFTLHTADSGGTGANELTAYTPQSVTFGTAASKSNTNTNVVTFSSLPAATITHGELLDGATVIFYGPLSTSFTVSAGQSLQFGVGEITNTMN